MKINSLSLVLFVLLLGFTATGQRTIFDELYHPDYIIEVSLQFDCKQIIRKKSKKEKLPASITYHLPGGDVISRTLKVSSRGNSRLKVCSFPPLKLDFSKKASGAVRTVFQLFPMHFCTAF